MFKWFFKDSYDEQIARILFFCFSGMIIFIFCIVGVFKFYETPTKITAICKSGYQFLYTVQDGRITNLIQVLDENNKPIKCQEK